MRRLSIPDNLIDYILVKKFDSLGEYISGSIIFGIYNSNMYYHSISNIPILRQKFNFVIEKAGLHYLVIMPIKLKF